MNNWYIKNLISGFKLTFFMQCEQKDFRISWHALIAILLSFPAVHFITETIIYGTQGYPLESSWYNFYGELTLFILLSSYLTAALLNNQYKTLNVAIMFLCGLLVIYIPYVILFSIPELYISDDINTLIERIMALWSFMIAFRIIKINFESSFNAQFWCALLCALSVFTLNSNVYMGNFYDIYYNYKNDEPASEFEKLTDEEVFEMQHDLLARAISEITPSKKGIVDLYGVSFASHGYQDLFLREARFAAERIREMLKADNVISLINNEEVFFDIPMANSTNLRKTLVDIGNKMQPQEDILLLYLTSHGGKDAKLTVNIGGGHRMLSLSAELLTDMLKESGIKNKIIIISACYSGSFIEHIKDENSLIITAASKDNTSFGCSDDEEMTYFADAYFRQGLSETTALDKAFFSAKKYVTEREARENVSRHSDPQIFIGSNIREILSTYEKVPLIADTILP